MLASLLFQSPSDSPKESKVSLETKQDLASSSDTHLDLHASEEVSKSSSDEYAHLQLKIFKATLIATAIAVSISAFLYEFSTTCSLFLGAFSGILYLRLLARSIEKLGINSKNLSKVQLVVPVLLIIAASHLPQLKLVPALVGFLLYKPALIAQVLLESRTRSLTS